VATIVFRVQRGDEVRRRERHQEWKAVEGLLIHCARSVYMQQSITCNINAFTYINAHTAEIVRKNYFPDTDHSWKKNWPPIVDLTYKMMTDKKIQIEKTALKRKFEADKKGRLDDTMLGFQRNILPPADGCHPSITISARSNKIDRFNAIKRLL